MVKAIKLSILIILIGTTSCNYNPQGKELLGRWCSDKNIFVMEFEEDSFKMYNSDIKYPYYLLEDSIFAKSKSEDYSFFGTFNIKNDTLSLKLLELDGLTLKQPRCR